MSMDVLDAARNLSEELNPNVPKAKLGLLDAVEMEVLANDYRILMAHCATTRHYPPVKMPDDVDGPCQPCLQTLSETAKEFSDLVAAIVAAAADGVITDNELGLVSREHGELAVKLQALMQQLAAMNAALSARAGV